MTLQAFRSIAFVFAAFLTVFASQAATAATDEPFFKPYTAEAFAEAQQAGATILVDVFAPWCPVCKRQEPILESLASEPSMADVVVFRVDWDKDKDFVRAHKIPRQSTILVFKGESETGRSVAETRKARLRAFVLDAVGA